ncbi:hypothetical protein [Mucilaginibacter sp. L3T2-6]|uniref:hypothetical protein n=1 Tax=Mucilaginibacter sp. L3T2-6 TaxID=3062491 RepID=UPI002676A6DC|nr:hypothetical protein [Mucilaginibacter sp. L3T2-6]MDO3641947.1 hypothetical protein [Mucilaginibacter sp. L3T2-6]MDV6214375.1 hypothetical protein [Mucilaginibacter sp. L3T2-6]
MTDIEILTTVEQETAIDRLEMLNRAPYNCLFARYVAIAMMNEEGIENKVIAKWFCMHPTNVPYALKTISGLLETNKQFKKMYIACGERRVQMEEQV